MSKKTWIILAGAAIGLTAAVIAVKALTPGPPAAVARAARGPIVTTVDERGKTRLRHVHPITMPVSARLAADPIRDLVEGSRVARGQVVARVVDDDLDLRVAAAAAALERIEASIAEAGDTSVEATARRQADELVESMRRTVEAAEAQIKAAEAELAFTENDLARVRQLAATGVKTKEEYDRALLEHIHSEVGLRQAQLIHAASNAMLVASELLPAMIEQYIGRKGLSVEVLRRQKEELQVALDEALRDRRRGEMASPVDGVVLARAIDDEQFVAAGTMLMEIGRMEDLEVEVEVLTLDAVDVKPGATAEIYGPAVGQPAARATVRRVYPSGFTKLSSLGVEEQRVLVVVGFEPDDLRRMVGQRGLGVGYRVRVRIVTAEKPDALLVPRSALFRGPDGRWEVYAVRDGRARRTTVEVGLMSDRQAEITSGLGEGDFVVVAPETGLEDGAKVTPEVRG